MVILMTRPAIDALTDASEKGRSPVDVLDALGRAVECYGTAPETLSRLFSEARTEMLSGERILADCLAALTQDRDNRIAALLRDLDGTNAFLIDILARLKVAQDEVSEARAERDRLVADVRALADDLTDDAADWNFTAATMRAWCRDRLRALVPATGPSQADAAKEGGRESR